MLRIVRTASKPIELDWVANNLAMPLNAIDPGTVPSPAAVSLLKWARDGHGGREFFSGLYRSQLPSRREVDAQPRVFDDGAEVLELIEKLESLAEEDARRAPCPHCGGSGALNSTGG